MLASYSGKRCHHFSSSSVDYRCSSWQTSTAQASQVRNTFLQVLHTYLLLSPFYFTKVIIYRLHGGLYPYFCHPQYSHLGQSCDFERKIESWLAKLYIWNIRIAYVINSTQSNNEKYKKFINSKLPNGPNLRFCFIKNSWQHDLSTMILLSYTHPHTAICIRLWQRKLESRRFVT